MKPPPRGPASLRSAREAFAGSGRSGGGGVGSNPSNRMSFLFSVLVVLGLGAAGVPNYFASSEGFAVENGRIDATRGELAAVQEVANAFRMVARVTMPDVVQISVQVNERDREENERLNKREDELRDQIRRLERSV